jgi:hypothetical protein
MVEFESRIKCTGTVILGVHAAEPVVALGSMLSIAGMLSFAAVIIQALLGPRGRRAPAQASRTTVEWRG